MFLKSIKCLSNDDDGADNLLFSCAGCAFFIMLWQWLFPTVIPFTTFEFFTVDIANIARSMWAMIPLFCYGLLINIPGYMSGIKSSYTRNELFVEGTKISLFAGIVEELIFRWIFFYSAIIAIAVVDFILLGFIFPYGILGALYNWILIPISSFLTAGYLDTWLYHIDSWVIGAAIISANGKFRDGHSYQGCLGYLTSWFAGMIFFYIMFTGGIFAAIVVHFFYDFFICTTAAICKGR